MKSVLASLMIFFLYNSATPVPMVAEYNLPYLEFQVDLPEIIYTAKTGLVVGSDGSLEWYGKPSPNAKVYFGDSTLQTIQQDKSWRSLTSTEFMERIWWIHGEGGGKLATYYASAIENRTRMGIGGGKVAGEKFTPSKPAQKWMLGQCHKKYCPTDAYKFPKAVVHAVLGGDVEPFNGGLTNMDISWKKLSLAVGQAAIGEGIPHINGWAGDDHGDGSVMDDIIRQGSGGMRPNSPIFIHQHGDYFHAFMAYKYKAMFPTMEKVRPLMINI